MFNRNLSLCFLALFCLSITACLESETPLSDPKKGGIDEKLIGSWKHIDKNGDTGFLHYGKKKVSDKQNWMVVTEISWSDKGHLDVDEYFGFTTKLGENQYGTIVNLSEKYLQHRKKGRIPNDDDFIAQIQNYVIFKYKVEEKHLDIWVATDSDFIKKAIKDGKIKGKGSTINDTQEKLRAFVVANDKKLFLKEGWVRYTKVK